MSEFRLLVVPGVTVDKWARVWSERLPDVELSVVPGEVAQDVTVLTGDVDAGLVRLPVDAGIFHAIPLYTEATVVVVPRDHVITAADEVTLADLADETLLRPEDDVLDWTGTAVAGATINEDRPATTATAVEWAAASVGLLVVPQSLARAYHRKDLTYRVLTDAPTSSVGLVWARERSSDLVEEMIGIVRGRTVNSHRGRSSEQASPPRRTTGARPGGAPKSRRRGR